MSRSDWTLILVAALALSPQTVRSNGAEIGRDAGILVPRASTEIRLVHEEVFADLASDWRGTVRCHYVLMNDGAASRRVEMTFVTAPPIWSPENPHHSISTSFDVRRGDQVIAVQAEPIDSTAWREYRRWYRGAAADSLPVFAVEIAPGDSAALDISYAVAWSGGGDGGHGAREFRYIAKPAALWAGTIDRASFRLRFDPVQDLAQQVRWGRLREYRLRITPANHEFLDGELRWEFRNWEPSEDISLSIDTYEETE